MGPNNKGITAQWFQALLKREVTPDVATIAAGDAPNDRELLEMADYALLMRNARVSLSSCSARVRRGCQTVRAPLRGPRGYQIY